MALCNASALLHNPILGRSEALQGAMQAVDAVSKNMKAITPRTEEAPSKSMAPVSSKTGMLSASSVPKQGIDDSGIRHTMEAGLSDYTTIPVLHPKEVELTGTRSSPTRPNNVPPLRLSAISRLEREDTDSDRLATGESGQDGSGAQGRFASRLQECPENLIPATALSPLPQRESSLCERKERSGASESEGGVDARDGQEDDRVIATVDATIGWLVTATDEVPSTAFVERDGPASAKGHSGVISSSDMAESSRASCVARTSAEHAPSEFSWDVKGKLSKLEDAGGDLDSSALIRFRDQEQRSTLSVNEVSIRLFLVHIEPGTVLNVDIAPLLRVT